MFPARLINGSRPLRFPPQQTSSTRHGWPARRLGAFGPSTLPGLLLAGCCAAAQAGQGLTVQAPDQIWPQWQARISLQAGPVGGSSLATFDVAGADWPRALTSAHPAAAVLLGPSGSTRGVLGAAVMGDYYFARPTFGGFRASGGVLMGTVGAALGVFGNDTAAGSASALGLSLLGGMSAPAGSLSHEAMPYLGLGFSSRLWADSLSFSADLGLVAGKFSAAAEVGRAVFGHQGLNPALREMRLTPLIQLGVRLAF